MGTENNPPERDGEERQPVHIGGLRLRATCKKRYGRSTLTIRRWGGLDELVGKSDVAKQVNAFRTGQTTAEDVAWAFVHARVESHSPTFRWQGASLERLIPLVADCSDEPHLAATTPSELADELVKAQDDQTEMLSRMSEQFSEMFGGISQLRPLLPPQLTLWAEENQRTFARLQRKFADLSRSLTDAHLINPLARLPATKRREMFPVFQPAAFQAIAGLPSASDLRIRLPDAAFGELSKSLQVSLNLYGTQTVAPAIQTLIQHQSVTVADVFAAAGEAAELAAREGYREEAAELVALSDEAAEVIANPSTESLEQKVTELSEHFDEFRTQYEQDKKNALYLQLFLWFLGIYLGVFQVLLTELAKG